MSFTDQDVMEQLQNVVIEPPDGGQTWPSDLWTMAEVVSYLNQRQLSFLKNTQFQFGISLIPVTSGDGLYDLPDDWITTMRVLWIPATGASKELGRSDKWEADNGIPTWSYVDGPPLLYYDGGTPTTIQIMPNPDSNGTLQVHYVPYSALLDGSGELMTLPDEFVSAVKYGALGDMLSKVARTQDPRAQYCAQRWQLGIEIAKLLVGGFA